MSRFSSQEFNDTWDDMSSSFQEQVLQTVAKVESSVKTTPKDLVSSHDTRYNKKQKRTYDDENSGFQVYRDASCSPPKGTIHLTTTKDMLFDTTNLQQPTRQINNLDKKKTDLPVQPLFDDTATLVNKNDCNMTDNDDDMWLEFDDMDIPALLDDMESRLLDHPSQLYNAPEQQQQPISLAQCDDTLQTFGGFKTAGSKIDFKPSNASLKAAHNTAMALLAEPLSTSMMMKNDILSPPAQQQQQQQQQQQPINSRHPSNPHTSSASMTFGSGFSTARGTRLNEPSLEAQEKARQLLLTSPVRSSSPLCEASTTEHTTNHSVLSPNIIANTSPLPASQSSYQYEDFLQKYGGFSKASGKKTDTPISEEAKRQALLLFMSDSSTTTLTQPLPSSQSSQQFTEEDTICKSANDLDQVSSDGISATTTTTTTTATTSSALSASVSMLSTSSILSSQSSLDNAADDIVISRSSPTSASTTNGTIKNTSLQRRKKKSSRRPRSKPFKSPAVNLDLVKAGLEKRLTTSSTIKMRGPSVFDMHPIGCRRPLSSLGTPKKYTKDILISMGIPSDVIRLSPSKARSYTFKNGWGIKDAEKELLAAGCVSHMLPKRWIENHYGWIVWKLARRVCMFPQYFKETDDDRGWWNPTYVVHQLLYRYEREINLGHRSVIKRIMEQDDGPVKQMVLMVADIVRTGSSRDKYRLQLTDGWYQISAYVDSRMNHMIEQGKIYIGLKISITGAQLTGDRTARTPLEALSTEEDNMNENDLHDITTTAISISSNSCLPCSWDTRLGYPYRRRRRQVIRRLDSIYDDGGLITMMDVVVCRKYPMMYSETLVNGLVITRNSKDEEDYRRTLEQQQQRQRTSPSLSSSPYSDTCQDRRQVSGYFKLRLCDIDYNNNSSNNIIATLLVSKATEVMHMDLMEGQCYRLYFVQPYQPKMRSFEGPYLITTRLTKWEHLSPKISLSVGNKHNIIEYPLRSICPCAHVKDLTKTDVDMVVYVLHTQPLISQQLPDGRTAWYSTLLVTDASKVICQITYRSYYRYFQDMTGQIIGFMNVRFDLYDSKCDIIHIKSSDESEMWTKPVGNNMIYMQQAIQELKQWTQSESSELALVQQRVKDLIR